MNLFIPIVIVIGIILLAGMIKSCWNESERISQQDEIRRKINRYIMDAKAGDLQAMDRMRRDFTPEQLEPHEDYIAQREVVIAEERTKQQAAAENLLARHRKFLAEEDPYVQLDLGISLLADYNNSLERNRWSMAYGTDFVEQFLPEYDSAKALLNTRAQELHVQLLAAADAEDDALAYSKLKQLLKDCEGRFYLTTLEYPPNWEELVATYELNPSVVDFHINADRGTIYHRVASERGLLRILAVQALQEDDMVQAKIIMALWNTGRFDGQLEEDIRTRLADLIVRHNTNQLT